MFTFLLDTNIFIQLEEVDVSGEIRKSFSEFSALCLKHKIQIQFHPLTKSEIERDKNESRRRQMLSRLTKYPVLENPPSADMSDIESLFGRIKRANDVNDSQLLFAIHRRCVNYLISEDDGLHQRARHGQVHERVLTVKAAINLIKRLLEPESVKLPHVRDEFLYNINLKDPIFDSLREGYKGFDDWYNTASAEQRKAWIVELDGKLAGVCIYKKEMVEEFSGLGVPNLKLCTFKVDEFARGGKLGELLLKQAFMYSAKNGMKSTWLTAFPRHEYLVSFVKDFGFQVHKQFKINKETGESEMVYFKEHFPPKDLPRMEALNFHIKYSPYFYDDDSVDKFIVPIVPEYHDILFPEVKKQLSLEGLNPLGNAPGNTIKKVYLSRALMKEMNAGSLIYFYRSSPDQAIVTLGLVEKTYRLKNLSDVLDVIGKRSVYTLKQIQEMLSSELFVIEFRFIQHFEKTVGYKKLQELGILKGPPQGPLKLPSDRYVLLKQELAGG